MEKPIDRKARGEMSYGRDMLPGEGSAMASYIASGSRIPRRGEVGIDSSVISKFESSGYVMSGSRHAAMNAVRLRKENQVLTVEGKRRAVMEAIQDKRKREEEIVNNLKKLMTEKQLKKSG